MLEAPDGLTVPRFSHSGDVGELSPWLFNDRLFQTTFATPDLETYVRDLKLRQSIVFDRPGITEGAIWA